MSDESISIDGRPWRKMSARARILAWILLVVAIASLLTVLTTGRVLFSLVETRASSELTHEAEKFHNFASAPNPVTGQAFTSPDELLDSYLARTLPESSEAFFSLIDGAPHLRSRGAPPARLDTDPEFVRLVAAVRVPEHGTVDTSVGPVAYAAIPVSSQGTEPDGTLVIVEFVGPANDQVWSTLAIMSIISLIAIALAGLTGWLIAGRVLAPIRDVRETAEAISETDLTRRIIVRGSDDVAQLATTFNRMLDRVQGSFDAQRRFLDDVGHELRTPITIIRGHLDVMADDPVEREQTLRLVGDELQRMSRLVDDLVILARSERPDFIVRSPIPLADLVVDTLTKSTALAERTWQITELSDQEVIVDGQRLTQALLQLVANAVKHTKPEDAISIGSAVSDGRIRLWVSDTGDGISNDDQRRIFERFERGSKDSSFPGSGLGLTIVARIAEAHDGSVHLDSQPEIGSTFTIDLPHLQSSMAKRS